jgi:hypothetical protein
VNRRPGLHAVARGVGAWFKAWYRPELPMLVMRDTGDEIAVEDGRAVAVAREHRIVGLERELLLAADEGVPEARVRGRLSGVNISQTDIDTAITDLIARKLIVRLDSRLVGLPLWEPYTPLPAPSAFPGGYFESRDDPMMTAA